MAMTFDVINNLKEWAPLTDLFNKLPSKISSGLFNQEVKLTCLDVLPDFLAIGTNFGIVFWYDRKSKHLERLRCEKQNVPVTIVKTISTVDYMVSCGCSDGSINIFQIPKSHHNSIPENLKPKSKQIERYIVSDLHKASISAIEWSKNGMKLFSGDKNGLIVLTEIDFYMHICKSMEMLNESYEVVQLSYSQQKLLISTTYRSIICEKDGKWKVSQVGKKDRKVLGIFGGIIFQNSSKVNEKILYCTRPGLRIWVADFEGNVNKTLLFKELLKKECAEVPIINPISRNIKMLKPQKEPSFGILLPFNENLLVTYNNDVIYILDPETMTVISTMSHFRNVLWVATYKSEIFVLEEARSIVRISFKPDQYSGVDNNLGSSLSSSFHPIASSIKDITNKLQNSSILPAISPFIENSSNEVSIYTDETLVMNAEEAKESPIRTKITENEKKFNQIGKQEFNDKILFKQVKHKKHHRNVMSLSTTSLSSNSSEEKDFYIKPVIMSLSSVGVLPDLRSPESIQNDIAYKEQILADILSLDSVKVSLEVVPEDKIFPVGDVKPIGGSLQSDSETETPNDCMISQETTPAVEEIISKVESPPACLNIPNEWKLVDLRLNVTNDSLSSEELLTDWEIV